MINQSSPTASAEATSLRGRSHQEHDAYVPRSESFHSRPWARAGREQKAFAILTAIDAASLALYSQVISAGILRHFTPEHWRAFANEAKVRVPSDTTIALIIDRAESRERQMERAL